MTPSLATAVAWIGLRLWPPERGGGDARTALDAPVLEGAGAAATDQAFFGMRPHQAVDRAVVRQQSPQRRAQERRALILLHRDQPVLGVEEQHPALAGAGDDLDDVGRSARQVLASSKRGAGLGIGS